MKFYTNSGSAVRCLQMSNDKIKKKHYKSCALYSYRKKTDSRSVEIHPFFFLFTTKINDKSCALYSYRKKSWLGQWKYIRFFSIHNYIKEIFPLVFFFDSVVQQIYYQISSKSKIIVRKDFKEFFNNCIYLFIIFMLFFGLIIQIL